MMIKQIERSIKIIPVFGMLIVCYCTSILAAMPKGLELNVGETGSVTFTTGKTATVFLKGFTEHTEPFYQSGDQQFVQAVTSVTLTVEIDGVEGSFTGGPFRLPIPINGVAILLSCTRTLAGGIFKDRLKKDVRLELNDAKAPWIDSGTITYPIPHYRWRASNYQHTYLGVVVNQALLYYHRGEDMGMIPDLEKTVSMMDGDIVRLPPSKGDSSSNAISVKHTSGMVISYLHMNTAKMAPELRVGVNVAKGQSLGLTGNYYLGRQSPSPHLHVGMRYPDRSTRNTFPLFVDAYRNSFPNDLLPIAGNAHHVFAGDEIGLDGSFSLAGIGDSVVSYRWLFSEGGTSDTPKVKRRYAVPGAYSEELQITDSKGNWDRDFVEVFVLSKDQSKRPPRAWINYYPIRDLKPGVDIRFLIRHINLRGVTIDFGDGTILPYSELLTHSYSKPGNYVVTVRGGDSGAGPGTFRARVIVEE